MSNQKHPDPLVEPSVWDHLVSKLKFWVDDPSQTKELEESARLKDAATFPWLTFGALILGLIAQLSLEPSPGRTPWPGTLLYIVSAGCLIAAIVRNEWHLPDIKSESTESIRLSFRLELLLMGIIFALIAFLLFGNGMFGFINTSFWVLSIIFIFLSFWKFSAGGNQLLDSIWQRFKVNGWQIHITRWSLIVLAAIAVILFFNFAHLDSVPPEMVSDQAEKLMDINDILNGHTPVYFPRNTGREVLHFYLTAAYMRIFNLDVSFLNLKVVAVFANLLTLFFIYLLGKEIGNSQVGLSAALFAGMAYWPLLFTRLALRIPYYPLFVAPVMYFMVRGLRQQNLHDILWAGLFLGLGLHGYTTYRIVPLLVVIGIVIYIFHKASRNRRLESIFVLSLIAFVSLVVFIPLLRYWLGNPDQFAYRAFSRLTGMEVGFQASPIVIFFQNFWKASVMFFWDNGVIWAHSIPRRPALEVVSGAFYFLGIVGLLMRYLRTRQWTDLFLLASIPVLMLPSILSLAYPGENPSLNRTAGAVVPVFVVIGLSFTTTICTIWHKIGGKVGKAAAVGTVIVLLIWSGANNYELVFDQYYQIYRASSWNTSELGSVAAFFIESIGSPDTTYVVGYPHWVDSRLVAINSGYPGLDYAIFPDQFAMMVQDPRPKLFFLNLNDNENMQILSDIYPSGVLWQYDSEVENKDFMIFFVPPSTGGMP